MGYEPPKRHKYFYALLGDNPLREDEFWVPWAPNYQYSQHEPVLTRDEWLDLFFQYRNTRIQVKYLLNGRIHRNTFYRNLRAYALWVANMIAETGKSPMALRTDVDRSARYMRIMRSLARKRDAVGNTYRRGAQLNNESKEQIQGEGAEDRPLGGCENGQ